MLPFLAAFLRLILQFRSRVVLKSEKWKKYAPNAKTYYQPKLYLIGHALPQSDYYDFLSLDASRENNTSTSLNMFGGDERSVRSFQPCQLQYSSEVFGKEIKKDDAARKERNEAVAKTGYNDNLKHGKCCLIHQS